jgi:hypothetical protein
VIGKIGGLKSPKAKAREGPGLRIQGLRGLRSAFFSIKRSERPCSQHTIYHSFDESGMSIIELGPGKRSWQD